MIVHPTFWRLLIPFVPGVLRHGTLGTMSVDASLKGHVVFVDGLSNFFEPKARREAQPVSKGADYVIIPDTLRTL